ncbi:MAG: hypothetical protein LBJ46_05410 [Planctomycetota bacterium]|nr:hypothetical protein [Planctomycetota bacterium]
MDWGGGFFERMRDAFHSLAKDMPCGPVAIAGAEAGEASGVVGAAALLLEEGE